MVYAALSIAIAAAHPAWSAAAMLAFGAATVPGLTVLAVAAVVLVLGLWSVGMRGFSAHGAAHAPSPQDAPAVHGHAP
jgi:sulfite exporter TauE/SafE